MKIEPRYLVQLAAVLEFGTLNEAAVRLGTTQPALSRTIALLERQLGVPLFERRRRPLVATAIGRELAAYGRAIKAAADQAGSWAEHLVAGEVGKIRVGAPPFLCDRLLSRMTAAFLRERPNVRMTLSTDYLPVLQAKLLDDQADMIVCPVSLIDRLLDLQVERLIDDDLVVVCRLGHPLLDKRPPTIAHLGGATWISHAAESTLYADMLAGLAGRGVDRVSFPFQSDSAGAIVTVLQNTDFLTMLPHNSVVDHVENGELAVLPFQLALPKRSIAIVSHARRVATPAMNAFKSFLHTQFEALRDRKRASLGPLRHRRRSAGRRR